LSFLSKKTFEIGDSVVSKKDPQIVMVVTFIYKNVAHCTWKAENGSIQVRKFKFRHLEKENLYNPKNIL
jgi:hypothetical protein